MSIFSHFPAFRRKHPKWDQNLQTTSTRVTFVWGSPRESKSQSVPLDFSDKSMITVSWEYWLCFTQFRLRWMTGFVVRSNGVLLTFVYFYQLGETTWTSTLYFLTFTEVARFEIDVEPLLLTGCDTNVALDSGLSLRAWKLKLTTPDWKKQSVKGRNLLIEISLTKVFKFVRKCGLLIRGRQIKEQ